MWCAVEQDDGALLDLLDGEGGMMMESDEEDA